MPKTPTATNHRHRRRGPGCRRARADTRNLSEHRDTLNAATRTENAHTPARPEGPVTEPPKGDTPMYCIDGEDLPLELLTADEARTVLRSLHAQAAANTDQDRALAARIAEVSAWLELLDDEAAAERAVEAAAEHAADIYADQLAGIH